MVVSQHRSKRKPTGGRYKKLYRSKRQRESGNAPMLTKIGPRKSKLVRTMSGRRKEKLLTCDVANVYDSKSKKYSKAKITGVAENEANRHYVRRNIVTRGTIIETDKGKARVTSRPGQEGTVNAVLV